MRSGTTQRESASKSNRSSRSFRNSAAPRASGAVAPAPVHAPRSQYLSRRPPGVRALRKSAVDRPAGLVGQALETARSSPPPRCDILCPSPNEGSPMGSSGNIHISNPARARSRGAGRRPRARRNNGSRSPQPAQLAMRIRGLQPPPRAPPSINRFQPARREHSAPPSPIAARSTLVRHRSQCQRPPPGVAWCACRAELAC